MRTKKLIYDVIASVGVVLLGVAAFLKVWAVSFNGTINENFMYNVFEKFPDTLRDSYTMFGETLQSIWATLVTIAVVLALLAGLVYIAFTVLEHAKIGKLNYNFYKKLASIAMLVAFVAMLVFGSVFTIVNYLFEKMLQM